MSNVAASVRARLLNVAKAQGVDFNQVLVRFALERVLYDFCESRAGAHARAFLGEWRGSLVCDDYAGYVAPRDMWPSPAARGCSPRRASLASST